MPMPRVAAGAFFTTSRRRYCRRYDAAIFFDTQPPFRFRYAPITRLRRPATLLRLY